MTTADFDYVRSFVREEAAIVLDPGKEYLVESRLHTLARRENYPSIDDLIHKLRHNSQNGLHRRVVEAMTTNETAFFRDRHPFEALRKQILPELMALRGAERKFRCWCGAVSTGQEAFSLLMTIADHFPDLLTWEFQCVASDLCRDVLIRAEKGCFSQLEVNRGLPPAMLLKHFIRRGADWEFRKDLRQRIEFREMNLVKAWIPLPPLDLVFLRNAMIYFDLDTKKTILAKVRRLLRPGGYLLLGGAESTFGVDDAFERIMCDKTTVFKVKQA